MITSKLLTTCALFAGLTSISQAALTFISITDAGFTVGTNGSLVSSSGSTASDISTSGTNVVTVSALDLDDDGNDTDTITLTILATPVGGNLTTNNSGGLGVAGSGGGISVAGEGFNVTVAITSVFTTSAAPDPTIGLDNFTGISVGGWQAGETYTIGGTSGTTADTAFSASTFELRHGSGDFRLANLDFGLNITPIPEPSSAILFGLGGLALVLRRRK